MDPSDDADADADAGTYAIMLTMGECMRWRSLPA
jgi:hypothetical protein